MPRKTKFVLMSLFTSDYEIEKLALYSPMKLNLRPNRVRVFFDDDNNVARIPQTG